MNRTLLTRTALAAIAVPLTACATSAPSTTPRQWIEVATYTAVQADTGGQSPRLRLDGPARLRYTVTARNRPSPGRIADIVFQDTRLDTESSRSDTIIRIDTPRTDVVDLGERTGEYFVAVTARGGTIDSSASGAPRTGLVEHPSGCRCRTGTVAKPRRSCSTSTRTTQAAAVGRVRNAKGATIQTLRHGLHSSPRSVPFAAQVVVEPACPGSGTHGPVHDVAVRDRGDRVENVAEGDVRVELDDHIPDAAQ